MRTFILFGIVAFLLASCAPKADESKTVQEKDSLKTAPVSVFYFHGERRCPSCIAIEDETKKVLAENFDPQVKSGTISFSDINVDLEENAAIAEKYQIAGSALLIIKTKDGKEEIADLTGDGFKLARNMPNMFHEKLKTAIDNFLK